jgi:hypothetical protein
VTENYSKFKVCTVVRIMQAEGIRGVNEELLERKVAAPV